MAPMPPMANKMFLLSNESTLEYAIRVIPSTIAWSPMPSPQSCATTPIVLDALRLCGRRAVACLLTGTGRVRTGSEAAKADARSHGTGMVHVR